MMMPTSVPDPNPCIKFKKHSLIGYQSSKVKKSNWKSLKQIISNDRILPWEENAISYSTLNPPPSFRPSKKYSDVSGLIAMYTDPETKIRYHNSEEFITARNLPSDLIAGYLTLRGAINVV